MNNTISERTLELLPCPFCGGEAAYKTIGNAATKSRGTEIKCSECHFKKTVKAIMNSLAWTTQKAIEAWNTRAQDARLPEDVGELIAAIRPYGQADQDGVIVTVSRQACDEAANTIEAQAAEIAEAIRILAAWDINALPNDYPLLKIAEGRIDDLQKYMQRSEAQALRITELEREIAEWKHAHYLACKEVNAALDAKLEAEARITGLERERETLFAQWHEKYDKVLVGKRDAIEAENAVLRQYIEKRGAGHKGGCQIYSIAPSCDCGGQSEHDAILSTPNERASRMVAELDVRRRYTEHNALCGYKHGPCDCGLTQALTALDGARTNG